MAARRVAVAAAVLACVVVAVSSQRPIPTLSKVTITMKTVMTQMEDLTVVVEDAAADHISQMHSLRQQDQLQRVLTWSDNASGRCFRAVETGGQWMCKHADCMPTPSSLLPSGAQWDGEEPCPVGSVSEGKVCDVFKVGDDGVDDSAIRFLVQVDTDILAGIIAPGETEDYHTIVTGFDTDHTDLPPLPAECDQLAE